jgi:dTDP-4-dehydrorhamnose 3,5-epimerase
MTTTITEAVQIITPKCVPGIGNIIRTPQSGNGIAGVRVQAFDLWPDDRGYFLEVARMQQGLVDDFTPATTQVSAALSYPGTIKAFHFHRHQTDVWVPSQGMFQVALVDLRPESPTYGVKNTLYAGALRPWQILIPPGVGHGYKVIGEHPGMLIYVTNQLYNPSDEGRIPYNDSSIAYDWELQYK